MKNLPIAIDVVASIAALLMSVLTFILWRWSRLFHTPHIKFSDLKTLMPKRPGWKAAQESLPRQLLLAALLFFFLAFIDIHYFAERGGKEKDQPPIRQTSIPTEGIAMYLVLDKSGSMSQEIRVRTPLGRRVTMTKMDLLKEVTRQFIEGGPSTGLKGRPNDMLGLVAFARGAEVMAPLTLDHKAILKALDQLSYTTDLEQDGTSIGYAIYKTANLIAATKHYAEELEGKGKPAYDIKSTIMILVTDGFQSPNPLDQGKRLRNIELIDAAEYARANGIKVYVINVEPRMASAEFDVYRNQLKQIAEVTGGKFFLVDSARELDDIYSEIDKLEKSKLPFETRFVTPHKSDLPDLYRRVSFYPYLIAAGMLCLMLALLLETLFMRRLP